jgi:hypothetical protein
MIPSLLNYEAESVMEQVLMRNVQHWVAPRSAWLVARNGMLWVTRSGDPEDHVLASGERLAVEPGDDVVLQAWRRDEPATWDWQPMAPQRTYRLRRAVPAWAWARAARALRGAAAGLTALARNAAARASRAHGCISTGDSIASGGAVQ